MKPSFITHRMKSSWFEGRLCIMILESFFTSRTLQNRTFKRFGYAKHNCQAISRHSLEASFSTTGLFFWVTILLSWKCFRLIGISESFPNAFSVSSVSGTKFLLDAEEFDHLQQKRSLPYRSTSSILPKTWSLHSLQKKWIDHSL